jgi:pantoate--beta-alanine ligase
LHYPTITILNNIFVLQDHLFAPKSTDIYPQNHVTYIDPTGFDDIPEGRSRPGHFRGVATIVTKLFNIVQPTNAYFGQKDAAQCCLIQRIVQDLDMDLNVVVMDTIREEDGLAMSSRNAYLTEEERRVAPIVYQSLCAAKDLYLRDAMVSSSSISIPAWKLVETVQSILKNEPLVSSVQYVTVDDKSTMRPIEEVRKGVGAIISLAVKVGSVRLIDNIVL